MASLKTRAINGVVWMSIEMIGVQAISFAVFATIAHFVAPRDFGLMSISFVAVQSLQMLFLYNICTVAIRQQTTSDLDFTTAFWMTIACAALLFLTLYEISGCAERLFKAPGLKSVLREMSVVLLFMGLSRTHEAWLMRNFYFKSLAIRGLAGALAGGLAGVLLAVSGFGVKALVGQQIINSVVTTALLWFVCPWRPAFQFSVSRCLDIAIFMRSILPNSVVYVINQNCDTLLIAFFFGPANAGFYNIGKRIRLALQLVAGEPIKNITLPALAEMQDNPEQLRAGVLYSLTLVCVICSPVFFGLSSIAHDVITVVFGKKWIASVPIMQILSFGGLAIVLLACNDNIFILKRRQVWCLYVSLTYTLLAIIALLVCFKLKVSSVALPFVLPYLLVLPLSAWLVTKKLLISIREMVSAMLPGVCSATGMFLVLQLLRPHLQTPNIFFHISMLCATGGLSYFAILRSVWPTAAKMVFENFFRFRLRQD